ncbi:MAG: hypothetical protein ACAH83_14090 [Alphaproteobacteria bacterium]
MTTTNEKELARQRTQEAYDKAQSLMKQAKEEILATAWRETPSAKDIDRFDHLDEGIRHYLTKHFNPEADTGYKATPEDTLFLIQWAVECEKSGARISQDEIKAILHKHAAAKPRI